MYGENWDASSDGTVGGIDMRAATSIYLFKDDVRFFGEGPCRLLRGIQECGSLRAAASRMNLSYSKRLQW